MTHPINPVAFSELHTTDTARSRAFYSELFGWKPEEESTPIGPYTMFAGMLAGMRNRDEQIPVGWLPYIDVADVAKETRRARELGGTILRDKIEIPEGTFSVVRDPTGAVFGLWQRKR